MIDSPPAPLTVQAGRDAIESQAIGVAMWAALNYGPEESVDAAGNVTYADVTGRWRVNRCLRLSARRIECKWKVWVTLDKTGEYIWESSGDGLTTLKLHPHRHAHVKLGPSDDATRSDPVR